MFVEAVAHQCIPDFKKWVGDGLIVNFDDPKVAEAVSVITKPMVAVSGGQGWHDPQS